MHISVTTHVLPLTLKYTPVLPLMYNHLHSCITAGGHWRKCDNINNNLTKSVYDKITVTRFQPRHLSITNVSLLVKRLRSRCKNGKCFSLITKEHQLIGTSQLVDSKDGRPTSMDQTDHATDIHKYSERTLNYIQSTQLHSY